MGMECPYGCGRQNVVQYLTVDGTNPSTMSEVIAYRLGCKHVVGGVEYEKFVQEARKVDAEKAAAIRAVEEEARIRKAAAYAAFVTSRGGK